jgi:hypothetical protein
MGDRFSEMLDQYPVTPYLDNRESFFRWTVFVHNKVNIQLNKPVYEVDEAMTKYDRMYVDEAAEQYGDTGLKKTVVYMNTAILLALVLVAYMLYF